MPSWASPSRSGASHGPGGLRFRPVSQCRASERGDAGGGSFGDPAGSPGAFQADGDPIVGLIPLVRRVIAARVRDAQTVDDLVQETLAGVMAARDCVENNSLAPYAAVTARNLVTSTGQVHQRARQNAHLLVDETPHPPPDERLLRREETSLVGAALARLAPAEREVLLAHEVEGRSTADLAASRGSSPGAIAAQLKRTRAKLRAEYLLAHQGGDLPTDRCRPVLYALSSGDRRRQRELDTAGHLLECDTCLDLSVALFDRRPLPETPGEATVRVSVDSDVVTARHQGRAIAAMAGFNATELTMIATAISEIARNIVKFAQRGEIEVRIVDEADRIGVTVVARDAGPGIRNLSQAMQDGFSTYRGLGLGLGGARRLMDQFEIASEVGVGTTVTMAKWRSQSAELENKGAGR